MMSQVTERRAQDRDKCAIAAKIELADLLAIEVAPTNTRFAARL